MYKYRNIWTFKVKGETWKNVNGYAEIEIFRVAGWKIAVHAKGNVK